MIAWRRLPGNGGGCREHGGLGDWLQCGAFSRPRGAGGCGELPGVAACVQWQGGVAERRASDSDMEGGSGGQLVTQAWQCSAWQLVVDGISRRVQ